MTRQAADELYAHIITTAGVMPKSITPEWLAKAVGAGMYAKSQLRDGVYYWGECRNAPVAKWVAAKNCFTHMRYKWGHGYAEDINHPEDDDGFDLFIPVLECPEPPAEWALPKESV